jgi:hypothetical protein
MTQDRPIRIEKGENRPAPQSVPLIESTSATSAPQPVYYEGRPVSPAPPPKPKPEQKR